MNNLAEITPVEQLSTNIVHSRFDDFGRETIESAKYRIIDVLGCTIAGAKADGNFELVNLIRRWGGRKEATILGYGGKVPACNAAMVNSVMARSFDFEPVNTLVDDIDIPCHISGTTVMTAIALGEMEKISGKELMTALILGEDFTSRILAASGYGVNRGWDCTGTVNMIGATAIAGRLLGLNKQQLINAFGIVLNQMAGSFQSIWDATSAFKLPQGLSARNGIFSAQLAKAGWTGPDNFLLSKFGYYYLYTEGCKNPEILTKDLGKKFYTCATFKLYPCCRGSHPAIDCVLALVNTHNINTDDIEEVILFAPRKDLEVFLGQPFQIGAFPHASASFNFQFLVANALLKKSVKLEHFSIESIRDPQIQALIAELTEFPNIIAKVKVEMRHGQEYSESISVTKGDPVSKPISKDEIKAKFKANIDFSRTVPTDNVEKVLQLIGNLESLDDVSKIIELLVT